MFLCFRLLLLGAKISIVLLLLMLVYQADLHAEVAISEKGFDDTLLDEDIELPAWFKLSFLDLNEDVSEAKASGKKGLVLYFGMSKCPYCKALIENNFGRNDIARYTQLNFDVIAIDVKGNRNVTTLAGETISEKEFSIRNNANFTPTLVFYNHDGEEIHRLVGYYSIYRFRAALEYVADAHYLKETFKTYLARGDTLDNKNKQKINYRSFSMTKPYILGRKRIHSQRPLLAIFEQDNCHACNVLHAGVLSRDKISRTFPDIDIVQIDVSDDSPLITPDEKKISSRQWADEQNIFYTPTLIFYDEEGGEILRLGSVAHFNRLKNVFRYIGSKAYQHYKNYAEWKHKQ